MYFITNKDNLIIAASKDFLANVGLRDICSLSASIKNNLFILDEESSEVKIKENTFLYNKSDMISAIGDIYLYSLTDKSSIEYSSDSDDDSIAYLRKIKEGSVKSSYSDFDIPSIEKVADDSKKVIETADSDNDTDNLEIPDAIKSEDSKKIDTDELIKEMATIEEHKEEKNIDIPTVAEVVNDEIKTEEAKDEKNIDISTVAEVANEVNIDESKVANIDIDNRLQEDKSEDIATVGFVDEVTTTSKEDSEQKNREKGRKKSLKEKLFPWSSSSGDNDKIELEDNKELNEATTEDKIPEESSDKVTSLYNDAISNDEDSKDVDIRNESLDTINISDNRELENIKEESNVVDFNNADNEIEDELDFLKKTTSSTTPDLDSLKLQDEFVNSRKESEKTSSDKLIEQLATSKCNKIDFLKNANNLSIDLDNYKLLLDNYLEEIDGNMNMIEKSDEYTINMLSDASSLLSLESITNILHKILNNDNRETSVKELKLLTAKLKDKLHNKTINSSVEETNNIEHNNNLDSSSAENIVVTNKETKSFEDKEEESVPLAALSINSVQELLDKVPLSKIGFDPSKAASELNLPKSLIIEFVTDFVSQAKTHLDQLVAACKDNNIKTLQTTAHMLKGAASNLRLDPIAEVLFRIQKEKSLDNSRELLKDFVSKLKGLEVELDDIKKEEDED